MGFQLASTAYDKLKEGVLIWIPALSTLYFTLASIWGLPAADKVTGTMAALAAFLGIVLKISKSNYVNSGAMYDGTLLVQQDEERGLSLNMDLRGASPDFMDQKQVILKVEKSLLPPGPDNT